MGDSEHVHETVETTDILTVGVIEQSKKSEKQSEHTILNYLQTKWQTNKHYHYVQLPYSKNESILKKPLSGKSPQSVKLSIATGQIAATPAPLENPSTQSSSVPDKSHIFSKSHDDFRNEQIKKLNAEGTTLKSLIMEQLYVIKKSVKNFLPENVTPNNLEL